MKKLILLLFITLVFTCCSNDDEAEEIVEGCIPNIELVGSWYWGQQIIVFTEDTFASYSHGETYFNNPSDRIYCIEGNRLYVPEFMDVDFYFELVDENSFLFGDVAPKLFVRGEDLNETDNSVCIELRIGEYYADDGSNIIVLPNDTDGVFDWGQEEDGEIVMYGFIGQNNCELDFTDTFGNWILTLTEDGDILSEDGSKIYYYID